MFVQDDDKIEMSSEGESASPSNEVEDTNIEKGKVNCT